MKFYKCDTCGNFVEMIKDSKVTMVCCNKPMTELIPKTTDGAFEKHVPVYNVEDKRVVVNVGTMAHPMVEIHYIEWIVVETDKGVYRKNLKPNSHPWAEFLLGEEETILGVYAYCNIHGLWKAE